jgi:hypothetical protein
MESSKKINAGQVDLSGKVDKATGERLINANEITKLGNQSGTNTGDQDLSSYALLDDIPIAGQLVKVTENGKTGYRLEDADPANYGDIGQDAVDLSISQYPNATNGATGQLAHASGVNTTASGSLSNASGLDTTASGPASHAEGNGTVASGNSSHAEGNLTVSSGIISHAEGLSTVASGLASHAEGSYGEASGRDSHAQGNNTIARSFAEHSGGVNGTDYTPQSATQFNLIDRLVNYGNGPSGIRSDAYTLFKNGMQKFFTAALSTITNATKGSVMLDENARMNIHDGTAFKAVAFTQDVASKQDQKFNRAVDFTAENEQIYSITQSVTITNPTGFAGRGYEFEVLAGTTTIGVRTFEVGSYVKVKFQGGVFVYNLYAQKNVLTNVTLTPANWTLVSGNRQATITNALIFLGSTPIVTPTIATANIADLAEIFEDIIVSNGSFILTARYLPTANIVIKTTLI